MVKSDRVGIINCRKERVIVLSKKIINSILVMILACMVLSTSAFAVAPSKRETIYLSSGQKWNGRAAITRTGDYSTVYARCYAVYPTDGGEDKFTRIQVKISTIPGVDISDIYTLRESEAENKSIKIREGYLSETSVRFSFRGNDPDYAAMADVYQDGR